MTNCRSQEQDNKTIYWYFIIKQPDNKEPFMFLGEWEYDVIRGCLRLIV